MYTRIPQLRLVYRLKLCARDEDWTDTRIYGFARICFLKSQLSHYVLDQAADYVLEQVVLSYGLDSGNSEIELHKGWNVVKSIQSWKSKLCHVTHQRARFRTSNNALNFRILRKDGSKLLVRIEGSQCSLSAFASL